MRLPGGFVSVELRQIGFYIHMHLPYTLLPASNRRGQTADMLRV